jgi:uncharacterized protein (TIGR02246 family)
MVKKSAIEEDLKAIKEVGKEYFEATNIGDPERATETMADDVIVMPPGRPSIVGKERFRRLSRDYHRTFELSYRLVYDEIEVVGNLGLVWATIRGKRSSRSDGRIENVVWRNLWILKRQADGKWKFWRIMFNSPASR